MYLCSAHPAMKKPHRANSFGSSCPLAETTSIQPRKNSQTAKNRILLRFLISLRTEKPENAENAACQNAGFPLQSHFMKRQAKVLLVANTPKPDSK